MYQMQVYTGAEDWIISTVLMYTVLLHSSCLKVWALKSIIDKLVSVGRLFSSALVGFGFMACVSTKVPQYKILHAFSVHYVSIGIGECGMSVHSSPQQNSAYCLSVH